MVTMSILQNKLAFLFTFLARREMHRFSGRKCSMPHYLIIFKLFFPTENRVQSTDNREQSTEKVSSKRVQRKSLLSLCRARATWAKPTEYKDASHSLLSLEYSFFEILGGP